MPVALSFAVLGIGGTATSLGLVLLAGTVAGLISYLVAGVWADRMSRRTLMLAADAVRLLVEAAVAVLLLTGYASIWQLALASVLVSIASAFEGPASTGLVAEIVPPDRLQKANSLLSVSSSAASVVGPALSGVLVATAGPGWAFVADSASFAGSAAFLLLMPSLGRVLPARQRFLTELAAGWREVAGRSWAWATLMCNATSNMAFAIFMVLGPVLALQRLGGASGWGLVSSGMTAGALAGGLVAMWVNPPADRVRNGGHDADGAACARAGRPAAALCCHCRWGRGHGRRNAPEYELGHGHTAAHTQRRAGPVPQLRLSLGICRDTGGLCHCGPAYFGFRS